jgi:hypothetical protein
MVSLAAPMNNRFALCIMFGLAASPALAADGSLSLRFSDSATGSPLPAGWKNYPMSRHKAKAGIRLVRDGGTTVLHIDANRSAGGIAHALKLPPEQVLSWRWKIDHSVAGA